MTSHAEAEHSEIVAELAKAVATVAKGHAAVGEDTELAGELHLDSLQIMNLLLSIEDRFDVSIPVNVLADVKTLGDLARRIEERMGQH